MATYDPAGDSSSPTSPFGSLLPRRRHLRRWTRDARLVAFAVLVVLGIAHTQLFGLDTTKSWDAIAQIPTSFSTSSRQQARSIFPSPPPDIPVYSPPPVLVTRPNSSTAAFTRHPHQHPYQGTGHHLSSSVHPSKDIVDQTHYILGSTWYFEQEGNMDWVKICVQGLLPYSMAHLSFTCEYAKAGSDKWEVLPAVTKLQERNEYVAVECPLPSWIHLDKTMPASQIKKTLASFSQDQTKLRAWLEMGGEDVKEKDPWQEWRKGPVSKEATTRIDETTGRTHVMIASQELGMDDWRPSEPGNRLGVCLSPIKLYARNPADDDAKRTTQLKDFVEWRVWHRFGGVEVVHWAARDPAFAQWVERLNAILGLHDTFLPAPYASDQHAAKGKEYGDQTMYLADCLMRNGVTDEFLAMTDLDEYMMARDDPTAYGVVRRLVNLPERVGTFSIDHTYFGLDRVGPAHPHAPPSVEAFPSFPRNGWTGWDTLLKVDGYRRQKSIYRTSATKAIWVHSHTELGDGFWRTDDKPGITPDKGDYPSQLELLHDRHPVPAKLTIEFTVDPEQPRLWQDLWHDMAQVLARPELEELWNGTIDLA